MTFPASTLRVSIKEGPVHFSPPHTSGIDATYPLWSCIESEEHFPAVEGSAFYTLTLKKDVTAIREVMVVETELVAALQLLATAWPFSGGSMLALDSRDVIVEPRFESNAGQVLDELSSRLGQSPVIAGATISFESGSTYRSPPLSTASIIAGAAMTTYPVRKVLEYHQRAWLAYYRQRDKDSAVWCLDLYKVRDLLTKIHGRAEDAKRALGVPSKDKDWSEFGLVLNNNDLRHAEVTGVAPQVPRETIDRLFAIAKTWVAAYLRSCHLPVV
jgi:hypothetical protein